MKPLTLILFLVSPALAQQSSLARPLDTPSFVNESTIDAPVSAVWTVWSTAEGYKAIGIAKCEMDFRNGGLIRSHYSPTGVLGDDGTIENQILAYEPQHMIAVHIVRPPKLFPFKEAWKHTWTVITLADAGTNRTLVRVASMGYGDDPESVAMRKFFESGNGYTLDVLKKHFAQAAGDEKKK